MSEINENLEIIYHLLVDNPDEFESDLKTLILNPEKIKDTNRFASLLSKLNMSDLINPLLIQISKANNHDTWLTDFMYAAINLLTEASVDDEFDVPESLVEKLKIWILEFDGELAWKAASLLKFHPSEAASEIQLKKLEQRGDFFLTYVECITGLLWYDKEKHLSLINDIGQDETRGKKLQEYIHNYLNNNSQ